MSTQNEKPNIDTLVADVYALFDRNVHHEINEDNLNEFAENIKDLMRNRLAKDDSDRNPLRFSSLGKGDRQIWYAAQHKDDVKQEELSPKTLFKFVYGDMIEQLLLFLIKESGHTVEQEQAEIEVDGVKGHIDAIVDGIVVDVKSASPFSFQKFVNGKIYEDDPFGYIKQLSGYSNVLTPGEPAAFIVFDKVGGDIAVTKVGASIITDNPPLERITHLKEVIASRTPPPRCYDDVPDGKSGNMKLGTNCSYCAFKKECWPGVRTFLYSSGPRFLTRVAKTPDVYEVHDEVELPD